MDHDKRSSPITPYRFSTSDLPPDERFDAWREHLRAVADLAPTENGRRDGTVEMATWDLGTFALCQERNPGAFFQRTPKRVRSTAVDHWYLFLLKSGTNHTASDSKPSAARVSHGTAGELGFYSLADACHGEMFDIDTLMLFIPRDLFPARPDLLDRANNTILASPLGALLADYLLALERRLPFLTSAEVPAVAAATKSMIEACLAPSRTKTEEAKAGLIATCKERARRAVQARLRDPALTPGDLALAIGISRSALYRMFEPLGGVAHYIRKCRLVAAHDALCDPADTRRIYQIANGVGFASQQEFSRAFRGYFGYSPSEVRNEKDASTGYLSFDRQSRSAGSSRSLGEFLSSTA
jgi:AraC-like DNA-binding protein